MEFFPCECYQRNQPCAECQERIDWLELDSGYETSDSDSSDYVNFNNNILEPEPNIQSDNEHNVVQEEELRDVNTEMHADPMLDAINHQQDLNADCDELWNLDDQNRLYAINYGEDPQEESVPIQCSSCIECLNHEAQASNADDSD